MYTYMVHYNTDGNPLHSTQNQSNVAKKNDFLTSQLLDDYTFEQNIKGSNSKMKFGKM